MSDIAAEIPGFEELSLVRWNETRYDGNESEDGQDEADRALSRYEDIKRHAHAIIRQLFQDWSNVGRESIEWDQNFLHHSSSVRDVFEFDEHHSEPEFESPPQKNVQDGLPRKIDGHSLYDSTHDVAPAHSSYLTG